MNLTRAAALFLMTASAHGQAWYLENFDGGNGAAWTFGAPTEVLETSGGFWGGGYLRGTGLTAGTPMLRTGNSSTLFTGNYRARQVLNISVGLRVQQSGTLVTSWHPTVLLVSFAGTPADPSDDWGVYRVSGDTLAPIGTWRVFTFQVPSTQTTMPAGWSFMANLGPGAPAGPDWNAICQAVDRLAFTLDDPAAPHTPQGWEIGGDYILISNRSTCYPNCDDGTLPPCLNINDFGCFLNRFYSGDSYANCDGSTNVPTLNVQDFSCFLMSYAAGCSAC